MSLSHPVMLEMTVPRRSSFSVNGRSNSLDEDILSHTKKRRKDKKRISRIPYPIQNSATNAIPNLKKDDGGQRGSASWGTLDEKFKAYDEKMVKNWNDEIDTILVFSGLFSAVLTAFNIESYRKLNADSSDVSLKVLLHISQQITSFTISNGFLNSTQNAMPLDPASFKPDKTIIQINILWFSSLVFSLVTASLGMLVKQWLREYLSGDHSSPRIHARVRQFRYHGLSKWRVFEIMAILPTLLQIALILFLVGLIEFLNSIHREVAMVIAAVVGLWFTVYAVTTILPTLYPQCPYKSPQARVLYNIIRVLKGEKPWKVQSPSPHLSWGRFEANVSLDMDLEADALVTADATFSDDDVLRTTIQPCLLDFDGNSLLQCLRRIIIHRLQGHALTTFTESISANVGRMTQKATTTIVEILLGVLNKDIVWAEDVDKEQGWIVEALSIITTIMEGRPDITSSTDEKSAGGNVVNNDSYISRVMTKLLTSKSSGVTEKVLDILATIQLRSTTCKFNLSSRTPPDVLKFFISRSHDMLSAAVTQISGSSAAKNPLAIYCVVLSLVQDVDIEHLKEDFPEVAKEAFNAINPSHKFRHPELAQQCIALTKELQKRCPGLGEEVLSKLESKKHQASTKPNASITLQAIAE